MMNGCKFNKVKSCFWQLFRSGALHTMKRDCTAPHPRENWHCRCSGSAVTHNEWGMGNVKQHHTPCTYSPT